MGVGSTRTRAVNTAGRLVFGTYNGTYKTIASTALTAAQVQQHYNAGR